MSKTPPRPRDPNSLARRIVDIATGEDDDAPTDAAEKDVRMSRIGRDGGKKGGPARAENLTPEERSDIAKKAAAARWKHDS